MRWIKTTASILGTALTVATAGVAVKNALVVKKDEEIGHKQGLYEKYVKRPQDFFCASLAAIALSPVMVGTAALVRVKLGTPVLFTQMRPGQIDPDTGQEKIFKLYKFRTMTDKRDEEGELLPDEDRLTQFGAMLRSTSLDELPELINIIKGDMAIVGPRPLLVRYLPLYNERQRRRHEVRPGLTGYAQVKGRNAVNWEERFEYDVQYVDDVSFAGDMKTLLKTVAVVIKREGIHSETNATMEDFKGSNQ